MANANAHFDPKALTFLHDTGNVVPHRDSGNARALEKSGAIGKLNVAMYICLWVFELSHERQSGHSSPSKVTSGRYSIATRLLQTASQLSKLLTGCLEGS